MYKVNLNSEWGILYEDLSFGAEKMPEIAKRKEGWLQADLPCDIHMPLIENGIIEEPLEEDNCFECMWTENKSWWFKKVFSIDGQVLNGDIAELIIESLDAEADIFLNGFHLGHHASAHYPFEQDVKDKLKIHENVLIIRLTSGLEHYSEQDTAGIGKVVGMPKDGIGTSRGDMRRIMVRKPQYVYGWDWGPRVATCGIMKNVYIKSYSKLAIRGVHVLTKSVSKEAVLRFKIEVENLHPFSSVEGNIRLEMLFDGKTSADISKEVFLRSGINHIDIGASIQDPRLWWPNGMGEQNLYTVKFSVEAEGINTKYQPFKYGIRTLELNLDKINDNERFFTFVINGIKAFCKGGNWIPSDSIYARVTDEKYETLIKEACKANFNMLRVWGGGIYEKDTFYEKCDEYGILVWHDFMFACAVYPDRLEWFKTEVEKEMYYQTKRLRNHACMALWCGNNENHWGFDEWWTGENAPAYLGGSVIYNKIAPEVVQNNCHNIPYWNSSPYGGKHPNGNDVGDRHHWHDCTMSPDMDKRITPEEYDRITSKFISEYGYIGPCVKSSIEMYHGRKPMDKNGRIWQLHNNTFENRTVPAGIRKHYADPEKLTIDEYLLYAGLCQGLMLGYSLESIRFVPNCWGSLFWMYNDCWGEVGWTIIDYYLKRKPSYYFVKRAFAPHKLILRESGGQVKVMGVNDTKEAVGFDMEYGYVSFDGDIKKTDVTTIELKPYTKEVVFEFKKEEHDFLRGVLHVKPLLAGQCVLPAVLRSDDFRNLNLPEAKPIVSDFMVENANITFTVSSNIYAHAIHFGLGNNVNLSDEYFDLLPGESRKITIYDEAGNIQENDIKPLIILPFSQ